MTGARSSLRRCRPLPYRVSFSFVRSSRSAYLGVYANSSTSDIVDKLIHTGAQLLYHFVHSRASPQGERPRRRYGGPGAGHEVSPSVSRPTITSATPDHCVGVGRSRRIDTPIRTGTSA